MSVFDWIIMLGTILFIALYGILKTRNTKNIEGYLKGGNSAKWWSIGISVMATQASAITFLSTPGQAYDDGMRFIQFYFGLPLGMIIISAVFIPVYYKLKVYTAYEFLELRFDLKTRTLTATLFLVQRALSTGFTIYAPSIILSQLLGWSLNGTVLFIGGIVTVYILSGGNKAIAVTHKQQMLVIYLGMFLAFGYLIYYLSTYISFNDALNVAGEMGKMNLITSGKTATHSFDWSDRYNIYSGMIGGLFLQLSYFGTDQSQVGRYLDGKNASESRLGLLFNGLLKIPVQFFILLTGVMVFVFYQYNQPPAYFNEVALQDAEHSVYADSMQLIETQQAAIFGEKKNALYAFTDATAQHDPAATAKAGNDLQQLQLQNAALDTRLSAIVTKVNPGIKDDHDYIFMSFVTHYLPVGLVGLLFAVIFCASMSSTASALHALAETFAVDIYKRLMNKEANEKHYLFVSKLLTVLFGAFAVGFALVCYLFDNLIEAVNILGSLFYGTILGVFLTAFFLKRVKGTAVFIAAVITELFIIYIDQVNTHHWDLPAIHVGYLWYNVIGCAMVMMLSGLFTYFKPGGSRLSESRI